MNVAVGVLVDPLAAAHERAVEGVNAWRGRCLASFTRVEMAVSEALVALAASRGNVTLPHMFGPRLEVLREMLGAAEVRPNCRARWRVSLRTCRSAYSSRTGTLG